MIKNLPQTALLNIVDLTLLLSWYIPVNHGFWLPIDADILYFFSQKLVESRASLWLATLTNSHAFSSCSLLAVGVLMLSFWLRENTPGRRRIVIIGLIMLLTAVVLNQLGQTLIPVERASSTLTFAGINRVNELFSAPAKDTSRDSLPGDHGMMLLIFSTFMWRYFDKAADLVTLIIFMASTLPGVMTDTHQFTDITVDSMIMILIGLPWVLLTPLSDRLIISFGKLLPGKNKHFQNK